MVLLEQKRVLAVNENHRLAKVSWINPEELEFEDIVRLPPHTMPVDWAEVHFPSRTPSGRRIGAGPVCHTVREGLVFVESGVAVMPLVSRWSQYFAHPHVTVVPIGLPTVGTAIVCRNDERRELIEELESAGRWAAQQNVPSWNAPDYLWTSG